MKIYYVGGCVRDWIMRRNPKDIDIVCTETTWEGMKNEILKRGGEIFIEKPEYLTIRGKLPKVGAVDFVLARKDGEYTDGRRPDNVEAGSLEDDLKRRDFTINAIAKDMETGGAYIDPFDGIGDIYDRYIHTVGTPIDRIQEDYLRILRALRFSVTLGFDIGVQLAGILGNPSITKDLKKVSVERIREELYKMFKHNTLQSLNLLTYCYPNIGRVIFSENGIWLEPTLKER